MMEKQSENYDLTEAIFFKYYENIIKILFSINTIVFFLRLTIFKYKLFKMLTIVLSIEHRMTNIGVDSRKSLKKILFAIICMIVFGSAFLIGLLINGIFYYSKIYKQNKTLTIIYSFAKVMPWFYLQLIINMFLAEVVSNLYGNNMLNNILLNAVSIVQKRNE